MTSISAAPPAEPLWRGLIRPMLLMSIALHGLLLFMPTPSAPEPQAEPEEKVSLTQLPTTATAPSPAATPAARPTPPARPTPAATPPVQRIPPRSNPVPPVPPTVVRPATPPAPRPTTTATPTPAATATPAASTPAAPATDPFAAGFPRYPGATAGSFGLPAAYDSASQRSDDAMEQVAAFFERELASNGYQVTAIDQPPNRRAFQVSKDGVTKVLTLIPNGEGAGTSIVLSDAPLPEDLGSVAVESPAVQRFYAEIPIPAPDNADWFDITELANEQPLEGLLTEPNAFFSSLGGVGEDGFALPPEPRAGYVRGVVGQGDPASLYSAIQPALQASDFFVSSAGSYGSGTAYQVTRTDRYTNEQVNAYLVVVPTQDGRSVLFLWNRNPQG